MKKLVCWLLVLVVIQLVSSYRIPQDIKSQRGFGPTSAYRSVEAQDKSFNEDVSYDTNKFDSDDDDVDEDIENQFPILGNNQWTPIFPAERKEAIVDLRQHYPDPSLGGLRKAAPVTQRPRFGLTSKEIQPWVDVVFPYVFVLLPLAIFIFVVFTMFVIANAGTSAWYARHLINDDDVGVDADVNVNALAATVERALEKFDARLEDDVEEPTGRPSYQSGNSLYNRRPKRQSDLDQKFGSFDDLHAWIDTHLGRYAQALTSDECMELTACQLGVAAANLPRKDLIVNVINWLSPKNDGLFGGDRLEIFKKASSGEESSDFCSAYKCSQPISHDFVATRT